MDAFEKVSVIVSIVSYDSDGGNLTMKSIAMDVNGMGYVSDGMGNKGGFGLFGWFFPAWHFAHPLIYSVTSFFMAGHQKSRDIAHIVFEIPGCPAVGDSW